MIPRRCRRACLIDVGNDTRRLRLRQTAPPCGGRKAAQTSNTHIETKSEMILDQYPNSRGGVTAT